MLQTARCFVKLTTEPKATSDIYAKDFFKKSTGHSTRNGTQAVPYISIREDRHTVLWHGVQ